MKKIYHLFFLSVIVLFTAESCRKVTPVEIPDGVKLSTTCSDTDLVDNQIKGATSSPVVSFPALSVTSEVVSEQLVITAVNGNRTVRLTFSDAVLDSPNYFVESSGNSGEHENSVAVDYINGTT